MKRLLILGAALVLAVGCGSKSPTTPSNPNQVKFTATLLPANEVSPSVTNAEASGNGLATITLNLTRDAGGTITAANADFLVTLNNFPANTPVNAAHIHPAPAGQTGSALISLVAGDIVLSSGTGNFTRTGITSNLDPARAQDIINNPGNYYFNVHSASNPNGFARGQLVKQP